MNPNCYITKAFEINGFKYAILPNPNQKCSVTKRAQLYIHIYQPPHKCLEMKYGQLFHQNDSFIKNLKNCTCFSVAVFLLLVFVCTLGCYKSAFQFRMRTKNKWCDTRLSNTKKKTILSEYVIYVIENENALILIYKIMTQMMVHRVNYCVYYLMKYKKPNSLHLTWTE